MRKCIGSFPTGTLVKISSTQLSSRTSSQLYFGSSFGLKMEPSTYLACMGRRIKGKNKREVVFYKPKEGCFTKILDWSIRVEVSECTLEEALTSSDCSYREFALFCFGRYHLKGK